MIRARRLACATAILAGIAIGLAATGYPRLGLAAACAAFACLFSLPENR